MTDLARLITELQAAEALQVCPRTLRKARNDGRLSYVLIGRSVRYTMDDLEAFIESARQDPQRCKPTVRRTVQRPSKIVPFSARN